jgi:hypothetical protein
MQKLLKFITTIFLFSIIFLTQQAIADTNTIDLSGEWTVRGTPATGDNRGCTSGGGNCTANGSSCSEFKQTIVQSGNSISSEVAVTDSRGTRTDTMRGTITGRQISGVGTGGGFTTQFNGTISEDGNTITAESLCRYSGGPATARGSFTMTRKEEKLYITL